MQTVAPVKTPQRRKLLRAGMQRTGPSSGNTPLIASKLNSTIPIISPIDDPKIGRRVALYRGVQPMMMPIKFDSIARWTDMINLAVKEAKTKNLIKKGDVIVVTAGIPIGQSDGINSIRLIKVS